MRKPFSQFLYGKPCVWRTLVASLLFITGVYHPCFSQEDHLRKISENLSRIKSASYFSVETSSAPGDTAKLGEPRERYYKVFVNPSDTLVGASSANFSTEDTTKMLGFYDGNVKGVIDWDAQFVKVDSFQRASYPFRMVYYPFYTKINEIIKYALTTKDSIQTSFRDYGDSLYFGLKVIDKHMYFSIKPIVIENDYIPEGEISHFDIWFNKKDLMPYRMKSKWHHITFLESCHGARFNLTTDTAFIAGHYFPSHFEIRNNETSPTTQSTEALIGKRAPDWVLHDIDRKEIRMRDLKSKVLVMQFTGIGCGPCHQSIPFLKSLVEEYSSASFELVSIESWSKNIATLERYYERNQLNFKFLKSADDLIKSYRVSLVPVFFVIDENRIIREVIKGYNPGVTDNELREHINRYL